MIRTSLQPFSDADLQAETSGRGSPLRNLLVITLPAAVVIFAGLYWISGSVWIAAAPTGLFLGASSLSNFLYAARVNRLRALVGRVDSVEAIDVEAFAAADLEAPGSTGPAYCFFSDQGQALLLVGQWQLEARKFPALQFRLLRMAESGEPIRIESRGPKITPKQISIMLPGTRRPRPVAILKATPETLQEALQHEWADSPERPSPPKKQGAEPLKDPAHK